MSNNWKESTTGQFNETELARLQTGTAEELTTAFMSSADNVILRALYELMTHGEDEKLNAIINNPAIKNRIERACVGFGPDMIILLSLMSRFGLH